MSRNNAFTKVSSDGEYVDRFDLDADSWSEGVARGPEAPMSDVDIVEAELVRRLLEHGHLNVAERALLRGPVRQSLVVEALEHILRETGWFPRDLRSTGLAGACLERRGTELWLHESHEIGVGRTSPWSSTRLAGVTEGVERLFPGRSIDGVGIQ